MAVVHIPSDSISIEETDDGYLVFSPEAPIAGLIFYPGAKVQYESYAPLMEACAQRGILCVLVHMPGNLAILDQDAAVGILKKFPEIDQWYLAGHSLGGAMTASYISDHTEEYSGLILIAAYSTADISESDLAVLSIYGSEDNVLKMDSYEKYKSNLPADFTEVLLQGVCHAYFGNYGPQEGDGTPTISNEEQIQLTADTIEILVDGKSN